jgi:biliverdin reductase
VARSRIRELGLRSDAALVAVASHDINRARELAGTSAEAVDDWRSLVERADIDAVMICTLNSLHSQICEASLLAGKHVSVDYPLALSPADAERLISLSRTSRVVLHVEQIELLSPWFRTLEENLSNIGDPFSISWTNLSALEATKDDWGFDLASGFSLFVHTSIPSRLVRLVGKADLVNAVERLEDISPTGRFRSRLTAVQIGFSSGKFSGKLRDKNLLL